MQNYAQEQSIAINGFLTWLLWVEMECYLKWLERLFLTTTCYEVVLPCFTTSVPGLGKEPFYLYFMTLYHGQDVFLTRWFRRKELLGKWSQEILQREWRSKTGKGEKAVSGVFLSRWKTLWVSLKSLYERYPPKVMTRLFIHKPTSALA